MSYLLSKINLQTTQLCRNLPFTAFQHCFRASWLYFGPGMTAWPQPRPCFISELHCIPSNSFSSHSPLSHFALKEKSLQKKASVPFCLHHLQGALVLVGYLDMPMELSALECPSCGQEIPRPHHRQPQESSTYSAQQYCWKRNKIQGLAGRITRAEKRQVDFFFQLTFHQSTFYESSTAKIWMSSSFIYFCIRRKTAADL